MLFWTLENNSHILVRRRTHRRRSKLCTIFPLFLSTHLYEKHWARRQLMGHKLWVCIHRAVSIVFTCCGRDIINCKIVANRINHAKRKQITIYYGPQIILFSSKNLPNFQQVCKWLLTNQTMLFNVSVCIQRAKFT